MNQVRENAMTKGMPNLRFQFIRGPVWGKTPEQLRNAVVEGNSPVSGKPVMQEIVEILTKPLTAE
jgi:ribosomal protein L21E